MKLEVEKNPQTLHPAVLNSHDVATAAADNVELLNDGIRSAQAGNRAEARTALFRVTETDPRNEAAWLWLASISEYPEELLVFLNNVLQINPTNERAKEWKVATNSLLAKTFVQRGIDAVESDRKDFAAECFNRALEYDQANEMAWLWMASLSDTNEGKLTYLEMVLKIDPHNEAANEAFCKAKTEIINAHLSAAKSAAALGQKIEATELLNAVIEEDPNCEDAWMLRSHFADTFEEKIASFEKVLQINANNAAARFSLDSLRSLLGSSPVVVPVAEPEPEPSVNLENSLGSISSSNLFTYEPEIDRNPTQELEMPAEKLEEFRDFAARNGEAASFEAEYVEQPLSVFAEEPVEEFVEQPVPLSEQNETQEADEAIEFEVEPVSVIEDETVAETAAIEQPDEFSQFQDLAALESELASIHTTNAFEFPADSFEAFSDGPSVDDDSTIRVTAPETYVSTESEFHSEEFTDDETAQPVQPVSIFEADEPEPATEIYAAPVWERITDESDLASEIENSQEPSSEEMSQPDISGELSADQTEELAAEDDDVLSEQILIPAASETESDDDDPFKTVASLSIPMPEFEIPEPREENNPFATTVDPEYVRTVVTTSAPVISNCSFCDSVNESSSISCRYCLAVLTLSDLDMIIGNRNADRVVLKSAVERMENDMQHRDLDEAELTMLGIGHLNLQNLQFGYNYLYEASRINPNNVVLSSQVNALLIRLDDIRRSDETADAMCKGKTILVVDDSPTVRKLIAGKLEKSGHNVFCSSDGVEALEMLAAMKPDLILLDINMPRMDGYQTCKSIRSKDVTKDIPVVMISGKDGFFDKVRGRMAGTTGYITKPFGPETLMKTVETYLAGDVQEIAEMDLQQIEA